jgi:dTMP kinase
MRPFMESGTVVISDRYVPSALVMQRFDGIDPALLWQINAKAERPDLAVILEADPAVIVERLLARGAHNRFQLAPGSSHAEVHFYWQATERLIQAGFDVFLVDCNQRQPEQVAACIRDRLMAFFATPKQAELP